MITVSYYNNFYRELYHGLRWFADARLFAPMAETPAGPVFIHDFVKFSGGNRSAYGRINKCYCKV